MLLFSSALTKHRLTFTPLSNCISYLPIAAKWAEDEWGYIRNKGVEYREEILRSLSTNVYIGTFAGQPVAMFALLDHEQLPNSQELMYVYVEKDYRGLGFGKQIVDTAKTYASQANATLILLDTLKPNLNRLYEKHGAKVISEGQLFSHPTDVLAIKI